MRTTRVSAGSLIALVVAVVLIALGAVVPASGRAGSTSTAAGRSSAAPASGQAYLALGDSLAASFQPVGDQHRGYAEQLFQLQQASMPALRLVKLGCPGERTNTIDRPRRPCPYPEGTQLDQAVSVLRSGEVAFATLQIGANDLFSCFRFRQGMFDHGCVDERLPKVTARLVAIVRALRAADPSVPIVGMTYFDPLLALWTAPGFPHHLVVANADVWHAINQTLAETYAGLGLPVADVEGAFSSADFDTIVQVRRFGGLPLNVARVCQWSYMCTTSGEDTHPTTIGYAAITRAVETTLGAVLP